MTDRNENGFGDSQGTARWRPSEGVRIIDAEAAQLDLDGGAASPPPAHRGPGEDPTGGGWVEGVGVADIDLTDRRWADEPATGALVSSPAGAWARSRPAPPPPVQVPDDLLRPNPTDADGAAPDGIRRLPTRPDPRTSLSWGPPPPPAEDEPINGGPTNGGPTDGGQSDGGHSDEHADTDAFTYARPMGGDAGGAADGGVADGGVLPLEGRGAEPGGIEPRASEARLTLTGGPVLPHWSEPAPDAGTVDGGGGHDRRRFGLRSRTEARWRTGHDDWDDLDVGKDLFADDGEPRLGALDTDRSEQSDLYSFDKAFEQLQVSRSGIQRTQVDDADVPVTDGPPATSPPIRQASRRRLRPSAPPEPGPTDLPPPVAGPGRAGGWRPGRPRREDGTAVPGAEVAPAPRRDGATRLRRGGAGEPEHDTGAGREARAGRGNAPSAGGDAPARARRDTPAGASRVGSGETTPARTGGSLRSRVLVGAALAVLLVVAYSIGPKALVVLAAVVVLLCAAEAFSMLQRSGFRPATLLGLSATGGLMLAAYWRGEPALPLVVALAFAGTMVWYLLGITDARPLANVAVTSMTVLWVGLLGSFAALLLRGPHGKGLFIGAVAVTVVADIVAYFGGRRWGRHPLAPKVSPGKTVEGFVAGAGAAIVVGCGFGEWVTPWGGLAHGLALGVVVAVFAPVGDLFESLIKRDLEIKDSGTVLGGHGGLLDRFDSLLLVLPATYYLADYLHLLR